MSSKRFLGKLCVYCADRLAETGDHVFARALFVVERRDNLPKVPACRLCNNQKAAVEQYLAAFLPFGGNTPDAARILAEEVPRRLAKNEKLHRELAESMREEVVVDEHGNATTRLTIGYRAGQLETLFAYIVRALAYHHFGVYLPKDYTVDAVQMREEGLVHWDTVVMAHPGIERRVAEDLGAGTIRYAGVQDARDPHTTIWQFRLYGRLDFGNDPAQPGATASMVIGRSVRTAALSAAATEAGAA